MSVSHWPYPPLVLVRCAKSNQDEERKSLRALLILGKIRVMEILSLTSANRTEFIDISKKVAEAIRKNKWNDGILCVFSPHTTGSVTINENWDADVQHDIFLKMNELVADDKRFRHAEGNSAAHIKTSLFGSSATVIIENGELKLGQWQGIYFVEWDGPREREVWLRFVGESEEHA